MDRKSKFLLFFVSVVVCRHSDAASTASTGNTTAATSSTVKSGVSLAVSSSTTSTTKGPIKCETGTCVGNECKNATVIATYTSATCLTGVCVTKIQNGTVYHFSCATKGCAADKKAAPKGTDVLCCKEANCNTYPVYSLATRTRNNSIAVFAGLILFFVKFF